MKLGTYYITYTIILIALSKAVKAKLKTESALYKDYNELGEHKMATSSSEFPYVAAILKRNTYISAGALIDENWVLTGADSLFLTRETMKSLRVRLGSINYKKGGMLLPIKMFQIHPYFDDKKPIFDIALIMLPEPVRFTPSLRAIRLQKRPSDVTATHFLVTSWSTHQNLKKHNHVDSKDETERRRLLSITHLHPSNSDECDDEVQVLGVNKTDMIMCLEPAVKTDACFRDVGAPVVLNGILWGIVSSWKPEDCENASVGPNFVTLVSSSNISSWIHATVDGHRWHPKNNVLD